MPGVLNCLRSFVLPLLLAGSAWASGGGLRDPEFARVPFEQWMGAGKQSHLRWSADVGAPELSTHQRILVRIAVRVDGRELQKRQGQGEFVAFFEYQDATGKVWQEHASLDLRHPQPGLENGDLAIWHYAFLLPGDFALRIAVWHSATGDYGVLKRTVHVKPLANDLLPSAWDGLPAVEFLSPSRETPDVWYLPGVEHPLHLPVDTRKPVHVELVLNATPSEKSAGSVGALRRNMAVLIPALKSLTEMQLGAGSIDVTLLDLIHRKVAFEQRGVKELDWNGMRRYFLDANPAIVDVKTLQNQWKMRRYFWDEISRRMEARDGETRVVIVLSGPAFMEDQEEVETGEMALNPEHRLLYIRCRSNPARLYRQMRFRPGARPLPSPPNYFAMPVDDLQKTAQLLNGRLFDASTPEQFRRVLASVISEIGRM